MSAPTRVVPIYSFRPVGGSSTSSLCYGVDTRRELCSRVLLVYINQVRVYAPMAHGRGLPVEHSMCTPATWCPPICCTYPNVLDRRSTKNNGLPTSVGLVCAAAGTTWMTVYIALRLESIRTERFRTLYPCARK